MGDSGRTRARMARERGISRPLRSHVDPYVRRKSSEAVAREMTTSRERGQIRSCCSHIFDLFHLSSPFLVTDGGSTRSTSRRIA